MMKKYTQRVLIPSWNEELTTRLTIEKARMDLMKMVMRDRGLDDEDMESFRIYFEEDREVLHEGDNRLPYAYPEGTIVYTVIGHVGDA